MWFPSWLRDLRSGFQRPPAGGTARRARRTTRPLCLERLEDRTLLSSYAFTNIAADSSGPISSLHYAPSINAEGTVAFHAELFPAGLGIVTGSGGPITILYDTIGPFSFFYSPEIIAGGKVGFSASLDTGSTAIFIGNGGPITTLYDPSGPFKSFGSTSFNDAGTVAFLGFPDIGGFGIFTGSGGATTTIADTSGPFKNFLGGPTINLAGTVAFVAGLDAGGEGIFTGSGGLTTTIADTSGPLNSFEVPAINDAGTVAFVASLDVGGRGVFTGSGGPTTTIADTSGPFSSFGAPSINAGGTVAFTAFLDEGGSGIFTGPDPIADKVIRTGDCLFNSTVTSLFSFSAALNDAGQVAFLARLANGRDVIVRADPVANSPPTAHDDSATLDQGSSTTIPVLANDCDGDGDPLTVTSVAQPVSGNGTVAINPDGTVSYSLAVYFVGTDSFTYTISDGYGFATATVFLTVSPPASVGIDLLTAQVASLGLNTGQSRGLLSSLDVARQSLANGNVDVTVNQLDAFIHQVEALERSRCLSSDLAASFIDQARAIQDKALLEALDSLFTALGAELA